MKRHAIGISMLVFFFGMLGYSLTTVVFTPLILSGQGNFVDLSLGGRAILLGFILFLYPFGQFCTSPPLGALVDKYGRRPLLTLSLAFMTMTYAGIAWALKIQSLSLLMISLFCAGLAGGNVVIAFSVVADLIEKERRNQFFGYIYLFRALGFVLGPLVGGKLTDPHLISWFGPSVPFWAVGFLLLLAFLWVLFFFPETLAIEKREMVFLFQAFTNIKHVFISARLRKIFLVNFLVYLGVYGIFRTFPMYLVDSFGVNISKLSEFVAVMSLPILLVNLFAMGLISKRFSPRTLLIFGAFFAGLAMLATLFPSILNELWAFVFCVGIGFALCLPGTNTLLSSLAEQKEQGRVMGNNQSLQVFGEAFSALLGGFIASVLIVLSLVVFSLSLFAAAALLLFWGRSLRGT